MGRREGHLPQIQEHGNTPRKILQGWLQCWNWVGGTLREATCLAVENCLRGASADRQYACEDAVMNCWQR